ncbi:MAG: MFS transporter [Candidatus Bathyarchaeota archaeon]
MEHSIKLLCGGEWSISRLRSVEGIFLILCIIGALAILSSTMSKNPVLKPFATSLGAPSEFIGFIASASTIPGILVSLPAASLSDIFGKRKVLLVSTFIFASAPFLYLLITQWWQLIIVRFYHGFATAIFVPVTEATIAEQFPAKRGERISLLSSATAVGRGIAPFLGGYILFFTSYSFHTLYLAVGAAGSIALITTLLFLAERKSSTVQASDAKKATRRMFQGWYALAKNRGVLTVSFIQASQYYVFGAFEFFLVGYLSEVVKMDPLSIGTITGSQIVALIILRPFMGRISDKISRQVPIILGIAISCILLLIFPFTTQFPLLALLSVGYGLGFTMVISSTAPLISELAPADLVGTSMGFLSTMMDVGQTLGPIISGLIFATNLQYVGLFSSFSFLLILSGVVVVLSKTIKQHESRNKSQKQN